MEQHCSKSENPNKSKKSKIKKWFLIFICFYVVSYFILSRASLYLNGFHNLNQYHHNQDQIVRFYYLPAKEIEFYNHDSLFTSHMLLSYFYRPLYWIDYNLLSGPCCSKSLGIRELM